MDARLATVRNMNGVSETGFFRQRDLCEQASIGGPCVLTFADTKQHIDALFG